MFTRAVLLLVAMVNIANAQALFKDVDPRGVWRRGNMAQHVTEDIQDNDPVTRGWAQISAMPEDDIDKWFITVVTKKDCPACARLKQLWGPVNKGGNQVLRSYATPESPKASWAHFAYSDIDEKLDGQWRWHKTDKNPNAYEIKHTPTIIVQPPRSGKWGNPKTIVFEYVFNGNDEDVMAFHEGLQAAGRDYLASLERKANGSTSQQKKEVPGHSQGTFSTETLLAMADVPNGFGQQKFPPLDGPFAPKPEDAPGPQGPIRRLLGTPEIIIVQDEEQVYGEDTQNAIDKAVNKLQPSFGEPRNVRRIDISKAKKYGIDPDETPIVLEVDGNRVKQKITAKAVESKGGVILSLIIDAFTGGGLWETFKTIGLVIFCLVLGLFFLGLIVVFLIAKNSQSRTPQVVMQQQPVDQEAVKAAAVAAALAAVEKVKPAPVA